MVATAITVTAIAGSAQVLEPGRTVRMNAAERTSQSIPLDPASFLTPLPPHSLGVRTIGRPDMNPGLPQDSEVVRGGRATSLPNASPTTLAATTELGMPMRTRSLSAACFPIGVSR